MSSPGEGAYMLMPEVEGNGFSYKYTYS
jgi:hypothetical protein